VAAGLAGFYVYTKVEDQLAGAKPVSVPFVEGKLRRLAVAEIKEAGLIPQVRLQANANEDPGRVFDQDPAAGTRVDKGTSVVIFVSTGKAKTTVPEVVGMTRDVVGVDGDDRQPILLVLARKGREPPTNVLHERTMIADEHHQKRGCRREVVARDQPPLRVGQAKVRGWRAELEHGGRSLCHGLILPALREVLNPWAGAVGRRVAPGDAQILLDGLLQAFMVVPDPGLGCRDAARDPQRRGRRSRRSDVRRAAKALVSITVSKSDDRVTATRPCRKPGVGRRRSRHFVEITRRANDGGNS